MATINWIASTAKNFSDTTAWSSGVVPGASDTAVFDGTGNGSCSLDTDVICSLIGTADYAGTFTANSKKITIPAGGVFRLIKGSTGVYTVNGVLDFSGTEFTAYNVNFGGCAMTLRAAAKTTWRLQRASGNFFDSITQEAGSEVTVNLDTYQGVTFNLGYVFTTNVLQDWGGKITFAPSSVQPEPQIRGTAIFRSTCVIDASSRSAVFQCPLSTVSVTAEPGLSVLGTVKLLPRYGSTMTLAQGDFRPFQVGVDSLAGTASFNLASGTVQVSEFQIALGATATNKLTIQQAADNELLYYGNISFTPVEGQSVVWADRTTLVGTADQNIDITSNTIGLIAQKTAGNVTLTKGDVSLAAASDFGGELGFASNYAGSFVSNGLAFNCKGFNASQTITGVIDIRNSAITNSGDTRLQGTNLTTLLVTGASMIMTGGTPEAKAIWYDLPYVSPTQYLRRWAQVTIAEGAYIDFQSTGQMMMNAQVFHVYGHMSSIRPFWRHGGITNVYGGSSVQTSANFLNSLGSFHGEDLTDFKPVSLHLMDDSLVSLVRRLNVPLTLRKTVSTDQSITLAEGSSVFADVTVSNTLAGVLTINLTGLQTSGNITISNTGTGSIALTGTVGLFGDNNQTLDLTGSNGPLGVDISKVFGTVTITTVDHVEVTGEIGDTLFLKGAGDASVPVGGQLIAASVDISGLTGVWVPGDGLVDPPPAKEFLSHIKLPADPVTLLHAATKRYVDNKLLDIGSVNGLPSASSPDMMLVSNGSNNDAMWTDAKSYIRGDFVDLTTQQDINASKRITGNNNLTLGDDTIKSVMTRASSIYTNTTASPATGTVTGLTRTFGGTSPGITALFAGNSTTYNLLLAATTTYAGFYGNLTTQSLAANAGKLVVADRNGTGTKVIADNGTFITLPEGVALSSTAPLAVNATASAGTGTSASKGDHVHPYTFYSGTLATIGGAAASAGTQTLPPRGDHKHELSFTSVVPAALAASAAVGTSLYPSRSDHAHPYPTAAQIGALPTSHASDMTLHMPAVTSADNGKVLTAGAAGAAPTWTTVSIPTISYGTPVATGTTLSAGSATTLSRSDHVHTIGYSLTAPSALGSSASPGGSSSPARLDHVHPYPTAAQVGATAASHALDNTVHVPAFTAADANKVLTVNVAGTASTWVTPAEGLSLSSTAPVAVGGTAAVGTGATAARTDHLHAINYSSTLPTTVGGKAVSVVGTSALPARSDHEHAPAFTTGTPSVATATGSVGTSTYSARHDHAHPLPTNMVRSWQGTFVGNGALTAFTLTHGLGTRNVLVQCYQNDTNQTPFEIAWNSTDVNNIQVQFAVAPANATTLVAKIIG